MFVQPVGGLVTWKSFYDLAIAQGGRLPSLPEARLMIAKKAGKSTYISSDYAVGSATGAFFPEVDRWAAVGDENNKDWVQIGNKVHEPGKSHVLSVNGYPSWGDDANSVIHTYDNGKYGLKVGGYNEVGSCQCSDIDANKLKSETGKTYAEC